MPPELTPKEQLQQHSLAELRQLWQRARADNAAGLPADPILDKLERKYQALADAAGATK